MNLYSRDAYGRQGVADRYTRMSKPTGIYDDGIHIAPRSLNSLHQLPLVIGLKRFQLNAKLGRAGPERGIYLAQGGVPVKLGLSHPKQVQIGPVEN